MNNAQVQALTNNTHITVALVATAGRFNVPDASAIPAVITRGYDDRCEDKLAMDFVDARGETKTILARPNDIEFWSRASFTDAPTADVDTTSPPTLVLNSHILAVGSDVVFALTNTAGNHPVADTNNVLGTVIENNDDVVRIRYVDQNDSSHTIRVAHTDTPWWMNCRLDTDVVTDCVQAISDVGVGLDANDRASLIEIRQTVAGKVVAIRAAMASTGDVATMVSQVQELVDDRLATINAVLEDTNTKLDATLTELEQLVTELGE